MNQYGLQAKRTIEVCDPARIAAMTPEDVDVYFSNLGTRAETMIGELTDQLITHQPASQDYLAELGHRNQCRSAATEIVMHDLVYSTLPQVPDDQADGLWDHPTALTPREEYLRMWDRWEHLEQALVRQMEAADWDPKVDYATALLNQASNLEEIRHIAMWSELLTKEARINFWPEPTSPEAMAASTRNREAAIQIGLAALPAGRPVLPA
ncbi:hypothetical protein GCM10010401_08590 [Rarobacter faecitabidus]|uniref:Uncharacterized protein n=1 Tax=Rarobacter faecitabidus TaxID=13243 RepID=A0A542ZB34_RARFA|nr:hypothetical protein [Rarobacter faecitabidus]TQL57460.1 hypothetical protein FB461_2197 [Rarobacter faecitabidus]